MDAVVSTAWLARETQSGDPGGLRIADVRVLPGSRPPGA